MFTFRATSQACLFVLLTLLVTSEARSQFSWREPVKRDPAEAKRIVGPMGQREPSRDLNIVWVWGIDKLHEKDTHEYAWVMDRSVNTPVTLTDAAKESPIFERFPAKFDLADEFYWHLKEDPAGVTALVTSPAGPAIANKPLPGPPKTEALDGKVWPVMWTTERGRGRVFCSGVGHNDFTFNDPYFRIILLRAVARTMNESFDPFKPLATLHLER